MKWKILFPVILLILIVFIIGVFFRLQKVMEEEKQADNIIIPVEENEEPEVVIKDENVFPEPTGNIDDTISGILSSLSNEETLIQDEKEADAIGEESQALSDFGGSYDESEF